MTHKPDLSIAIVSYNTKDLLDRCLASVYRTGAGLNIEVFVVDNASTDGSVEMVRNDYPQVELIANPANLFFTKANNQAFEQASGRYLLTLNSDTEIQDGGLAKLVHFMDKHPEVGAAEGKQVDWNTREVLHTSSGLSTPWVELFEWSGFGRLFPRISLLRKYRIEGWDRNSTREVDVVCDAFMIVRREAFRQIGCYDEELLLYYTENDLCLRLKRAGWRVYHVADALTLHGVNQSTKKEKVSRISQIYLDDMLTYYRKHFGITWATAIQLSIGSWFAMLSLAVDLRSKILKFKANKWISIAVPEVDTGQMQFYNNFHNTTQMQRAVITHSNFTYRIVLRIVDKYLQNALRVVDVGCGSGVLSFYIASKRIRVLGTDVSSLAIRSCVQSADYLGLKDWTEFRCASFLDDNLGAERFDLAICSEVIEHLPDDRLAVQRLTHLLMPGGLLILSTPSARAPIHLFRMRLWGKDGCDERVGHLRRYALEDLVALIEEAGFKIIERKRTEGMIRNFFFVTPIGNKLLRFVRWKMADLISWLDEMTIDFLGESQLIVVARKKSF